MLFKVERRPEVSLKLRLAAPLIATLCTLLVGVLLFSSLAHNPIDALRLYFIVPLSTINGLSEWLLKASPLILIACGLAVGFRANVWNIGAEGQLVMGAVAAGAVGLFYPNPESPFLIVMMLIAGALAGMSWAAIAAFLKARMNTSEILVTLMLSYVAALFLSWLVHGPWRDPMGFNYPQTAMLPEAGLFEPFNMMYRLTPSIFITMLMVVATWLFIDKSHMGYKMKVSGAAPLAARYAGFKQSSAIWIGLLVSGAAAGAAGMMELAGPLGQLSPQISPGYGFAAIIVAFIGRLNAWGIVLGGLLMSLLLLGGESIQMSMGIPSSITRIFQGILLFFLLAADFFAMYRIRRVRGAA